MDFPSRVLALFDEFDEHDKMCWRNTPTGIDFFALCNDFFFWGCADSESITPDNLQVLRECFEAVGENHREWAPLLFCARIRKLRPQGCAYPMAPKLRELFDACGSKRPVSIGNPYNHPDDGGEYAYVPEPCIPKETGQ